MDSAESASAGDDLPFTGSELFDLIEQGVSADLRTPAMVYFAAERLADAYAGTSRRHHPLDVAGHRMRGSDRLCVVGC